MAIDASLLLLAKMYKLQALHCQLPAWASLYARPLVLIPVHHLQAFQQSSPSQHT